MARTPDSIDRIELSTFESYDELTTAVAELEEQLRERKAQLKELTLALKNAVREGAAVSPELRCEISMEEYRKPFNLRGWYLRTHGEVSLQKLKASYHLEPAFGKREVLRFERVQSSKVV